MYNLNNDTQDSNRISLATRLTSEILCPSIHPNYLSTDETGCGSTQETDNRGHFLGPAITFQGSFLNQTIVVNFMNSQKSLGHSPSWSHAVDCNVMRPQLFSEAACVTVDCRLSDRIN